MTLLEELEAKYTSEMTERERAELEAQIWSLIPASVRTAARKHGMVAYMNEKFGTDLKDVRCRQRLLRFGPAADPLWDRLTGDMPTYTVISIAAEANQMSRDRGISLNDAVILCIAKYDKMGHGAKYGGKVVRRRHPGKMEDAPLLGDVPTDLPSGRGFWTQIRKLIFAYVKERLPATDETQRDILVRNFEADIKRACTDFQQALYSAPKTGLASSLVSRKRLIQACRNLGVDPPRPGQKADPDLVRKKYRVAMRTYHPDVHGGSEVTRPQYEAVEEAYKIVKKYNEDLDALTVNLETTGSEGESDGDGKHVE
jgi:hypothetical protein